MIRILVFLFLFCGAAVFFSASACADMVGSLQFTVKNAENGKPVTGAVIKLTDSANIKPSVVLTTDAAGKARASQLQARPWKINTSAKNYEPDSRMIGVVPGAVTEVEIDLEPVREKVIKVTARLRAIHLSATTQSTRVGQNFIKTFPSNAANPQSLTSVLKGNPGFVGDSVNQVHPRGEHSATSIYINGYELPGALQGRAGQVISAQTVQDVDLLTGSFAPEYGGETAAILNVALRSGTIQPFEDYELQGGGFGTGFGSVTLGGQAGAAVESGLENAQNAPKRFGYLVNLSGRETENALEPPQPDNQTAHNEGFSQILFGNFNYYAGEHDQLQVAANSAPAYTQIADRTGLPDSYAPYGQGYGYGGQLSRVQAQAQGIANQQDAGQDINQRDANTFGVINWRHTFAPNLFSLFSAGSSHSGMGITNNNPAVNLFALPSDSSIEFNPTLFRDAYETQTQGSLTWISGNHTFKGGFLDDEQTGKESYNLIPASRLALDHEVNIDPRLAPSGTFTGATDSDGLPVYTPNPGAPVPTLDVSRAGFYRAAFLQDTWKINPVVTVNYGLRFDRYRQIQNLGQAPVDQSNVSPRVNTAFAVTRDSVLRLSYDSLFIQPPLAQGAIIGEPIQPETLKQYEVDYAFQPAPGQRITLADYYKDIRHQIDTGLLFPLTQIGIFTSVNFDIGQIHGFEFSYELSPPDNIGVSSYVAYTYQIDRPFGLDNTGAPVPQFNDHDQRNTLGLGVAETWASGANVGLNFYYGSGLFSSAFVDNRRIPNTEVDLHFGTPPLFFKSAFNEGVGLALDIVNLMDSRRELNFQSGFSGTRFQQGRQVLLSMNGHF